LLQLFEDSLATRDPAESLQTGASSCFAAYLPRA
jgi:hypothetical protein